MHTGSSADWLSCPLVLSINGVRLAIRGFRERERNYLTCKIGLPAGFVSVILFLAIFIGGLS